MNRILNTRALDNGDWSTQLGRSQDRNLYDGFKLVDKTGNPRKPAGYRASYQMIGTWTVLDPKGNQMHDVYASRGAAEYYRRNGRFADGTVLVKKIDGAVA